MKIFRQFLVIIFWLLIFLITSLFLFFTFLIALVKGRQEQYFTQKPIFDSGENKV